MARSTMQKQKLLYLQKIMLERTDEEHSLTINEIIEALSAYGISAERKSLYNDLEILEQFGIDICRIKTNTTRYYVGKRDFEMPELKLLVDAIQSSKFITQKKSLSLIKKLEGLASEHEGKQLSRQMFISNTGKNLNEKIYYNVDAIHTAIAQNRKIHFNYYRWKIDFDSTKKIVRENRKAGGYTVSPWALRWDDENYYLIGYDENSAGIKHFRVDKIESIGIDKNERDGKEEFDKLDIRNYTQSMFSMFGGKETEVTLEVDNNLIGVIVDRFGSDIFITKESENSFRVTVTVILSPQFFAWLFGLGKEVKILAPLSARQEYIRRAEEVLQAYN